MISRENPYHGRIRRTGECPWSLFHRDRKSSTVAEEIIEQLRVTLGELEYKETVLEALQHSVVTCVDCKTRRYVSDCEYQAPNGLIPVGFRCHKCWPDRFDNA